LQTINAIEFTVLVPILLLLPSLKHQLVQSKVGSSRGAGWSDGKAQPNTGRTQWAGVRLIAQGAVVVVCCHTDMHAV
jgi:hypothetical protein